MDGETIPLDKAELKPVEALQTSHLRQIHFIPYTAHVPNAPVRRPSKVHTVESHLIEARLRTWGQACGDPPHSFFRVTLFGHAVGERPNQSHGITYLSHVQEAVRFFQEESLQFRDWSLDPALLLDAQDLHQAATVESWPHGEKVQKWPDPYDTPTPTYAGNYIWCTKSEWLTQHMRKSLQAYKAEVGIRPTRSLEAVSHLALRPKLFKLITKQRVVSYEASTDPPYVPQGHRLERTPDIPCPECGTTQCASVWVIEASTSTVWSAAITL